MHIIGLLIGNTVDRRLVSEFLRDSGHAVQTDMPAETHVRGWAEVSMVIADAAAARQHAAALAALKRQTPEVFLPLLVAVRSKEAGNRWLDAGFDDVLHLPVAKSELAARVAPLLRIRDLLNADRVAAIERMRQVTRQVLLAQEEERKRLSRDLHDELGQSLAVLKISLGLIEGELPVTATVLRRRLGEADKLTDAIIEQMRQIARELRPMILDEFGLYVTLETLCQNFSERTQLTTDCNFGGEEPTLTEEVKIGLYRFVQEALTNVAKHSQAHKVRVSVDADEAELRLSVTDDGLGFNVAATLAAATGIGLLGLRERIDLLGGQLEIESRPGHGTRLVAHVALAPNASPSTDFAEGI